MIAFLKRNVEVAGIEDLSKFFLNRAQDFVLIEARADGLADLGQQFVLLGAALRVVHDDVVFERQADLQGQADQQAEVRGAEHAQLGVREQDYAEVVFARLQADCGQVPDVFFRQRHV